MGKKDWKDRSKDPDSYTGSFDFNIKQQVINELLHKIQTAIKFLREKEIADGVSEDRQFTGPKHNRVGIDNALIENGALVALLVEKGIIKYQEYIDTYIEFLERDVERYEGRIKDAFGPNVKIGG